MKPEKDDNKYETKNDICQFSISNYLTIGGERRKFPLKKGEPSFLLR